MSHRKRIALLSLGAAMAWGVGTAAAQSVGSDASTGSNPAKGDGAIQPGTLEHATGAGDTDATAKDQIAMSAPVTASAEEISQHPGQFFGKRVTLTTRVDQSVDPHFFTVESMAINQRPPDNRPSQAEQFQPQPVLVLIDSPVRAAAPQTTLTIVGQVRPFVATDIEREYSWFQRDWPKEANLDTAATPKAVIVADSVMTADGMQLVQGATTSGHIQAGDAPLPNPPAPPHREGEPLDGNAPRYDAIE